MSTLTHNWIEKFSSMLLNIQNRYVHYYVLCLEKFIVQKKIKLEIIMKNVRTDNISQVISDKNLMILNFYL